ncbi:MAG: hypothetical protein ABJC24_00370 [Chloroflexota bacterium]
MQKRVAGFMSLLMLAGLIALPASATTKCFPDRYIMYEHSNYGGHSRGECTSEPDLRDVEWGIFAWEDFNDMISSLKTLGQYAYFYDGANYSNLLKYYGANQNISFVGDTLNDRFGSVWNGYP